MSGPLNYTTRVPAAQSLSECQTALAEHGADAIAVTYTDRRPAGLRFQFEGNAFSLPVDVAAMSRVLAKAEKDGAFRAAKQRGGFYSSPEHAERVAWRVVKDWLEAQLALVAAQQVQLDEVMLPYLIVDDGRALREQWRDRLALGPGSS